MKRLIGITILLHSALAVLSQNSLEQNLNETPDSSDALTYEAQYVGDICGNTKGGIKSGTGYLGMANLKIGFNTQNASLWKGGEFFLNGVATHGDSPSAKLIGDYQVASNIEAGNHIYLQELWFKQRLSAFELTLGLQDLNAEYICSENGGMFINSAFGVPSLISDNIPLPIFPLTTLGVSGKLNIRDRVVWQAAVFDGCATDFDYNSHNTHWKLTGHDGAFLVSELQLLNTNKQYAGTYKLGYYYHTGLSQKNDLGVFEKVFDYNYGFYAIADQTIYGNEASNRSISAFAQVAASPRSINNLYYYMGGGLNFNEMLKTRFSNSFGVAFAYSRFHNSIQTNETVFEVYCKLQVTANIAIQPDLQYIINPMGSDQLLDNALVAFMRTSINF
ncbi:MAG: carbohydrate porin [Bacteroidales bacterium]